MEETEKRQKDVRFKSDHIIKYNKCVWSKHCNYKEETIILAKETSPKHMPSIRNPLYLKIKE